MIDEIDSELHSISQKIFILCEIRISVDKLDVFHNSRTISSVANLNSMKKRIFFMEYYPDLRLMKSSII